MRLPDIVSVTAFVDWNAQIHAARIPKNYGEFELAEKTLSYVCGVVGNALYLANANNRYDVILRLYHGWHKGFEKTNRRKALVQVVAGADFISLSSRPTIAFREGVEFGDLLLSALADRLHKRLNCHLPNTLRSSIRFPDEWEEKMVDTAIASDVVDLAYREKSRWLIMLGDDDDLVPPAFVAEGIRGSLDGKVLLIRTRSEGPFLKLKNLGFKP